MMTLGAKFWDINVRPLVNENRHYPTLKVVHIECREAIYTRKASSECRFNCARADLQKLYFSIGLLGWRELQQINHVNVAIDHLYDIHSAWTVWKIVPKCKTTPRVKFSRRFTADIIVVSGRRTTFLRLCKKLGIIENAGKAKDLSCKIKIKSKSKYRKYKDLAQVRWKATQNNYWSYVNEKKQTTRIPGTIKYGNNGYTTPCDIAESFASDLGSVY